MKRNISFLLFMFLLTQAAISQNTYTDSINSYQQSYVKNHGVIEGNDKQYLHFFPASKNYRVTGKVERIYEAPWFKMETSGNEKQVYRVYAILHFKVNDTTLKLQIYQSQRLMATQEYANHLFIPFTDLTSGDESYDNGRYIDLTISDLESGVYVIDFNKAYNPYCAYISNQYNCPVPPKENDLPVHIKAGEMKFGKEH